MQFCYTTEVFMNDYFINRSDTPIEMMQAWDDLRWHERERTSEVTGVLSVTENGNPTDEGLKYLKRLNHTGRSVNHRRPYMLLVTDRAFDVYHEIVRYFCPYIKLVRLGHTEDYPGIYWLKVEKGWVAFETKWYGLSWQQGANWTAGK